MLIFNNILNYKVKLKLFNNTLFKIKYVIIIKLLIFKSKINNIDLICNEI